MSKRNDDYKPVFLRGNQNEEERNKCKRKALKKEPKSKEG